MKDEMVIKSRIRKELDEIDRDYRIYRYSYKTLLISSLLVLVITTATYLGIMDIWEWLFLNSVLTCIIVFSSFTFLKYYNRIHENPGDVV